jgi:tellurite resistance protein TerC
MASFNEIADINLQYLLWPGLMVFIGILLMFDIGIFRRFRYLKITLLLSLLLVAAHLLSIPWYSLPDHVLLIIIAVLVLSGVLFPLLGNPFDIERHLSPLVDDIEEYALLVYKHARRVIILLVGSTVVVIGIAMLVTPAPAILVIPIGLGILAIEFAWARRWLLKFRKTMDDLQQKILQKIKSSNKKDDHPLP